jgi:hypothetical protein
MLNNYLFKVILLALSSSLLYSNIYLRTTTKEVDLTNDLNTLNTKEYEEEYKKELYELEDLYAIEDLFNNMNMNTSQYERKLSILKKILKREAVLDYFKDKYTISRSEYLSFFDNHDLYLPKRYNMELLKYKDKKTALRVFSLLKTGQSYKEIKIIISKISKLEEYNKNYIMLKEIEEGKVNNNLKNILLNTKKPILVNKILDINKIYYIVLINDVIPSFGKEEYLLKIKQDARYKLFIDNSIHESLLKEKSQAIKKLYNYQIIIK